MRKFLKTAGVASLTCCFYAKERMQEKLPVAGFLYYYNFASIS